MPSREAAQLKVSGLGSHVAVKRAREWKEEGGGLVGGARLRKNQQSRSIPCAKAARCARAATALTHVEPEERRSTERDRGRVGTLGREFFAILIIVRVVHGVVHVNTREDLCDLDFVRGAAGTEGLRRLRLNNSRRDPQIRKAVITSRRDRRTSILIG